MNDPPDTSSSDTYKGATVIDPTYEAGLQPNNRTPTNQNNHPFHLQPTCCK